jgi:hypothetical protein
MTGERVLSDTKVGERERCGRLLGEREYIRLDGLEERTGRRTEEYDPRDGVRKAIGDRDRDRDLRRKLIGERERDARRVGERKPRNDVPITAGERERLGRSTDHEHTLDIGDWV